MSNSNISGQINSLIGPVPEASVVSLENGSKFITPLGRGQFSFLHCLFQGCTEREIDELRLILGFNPSDDYLNFMRFSDGAIFFDNTLIIFGIKNNQGRSLRLEDYASISLSNEVYLARARAIDLLWVPIGSLSAATKTFILETDPDGRFRFGLPLIGYKHFASFMTALSAFLNLLRDLSDERGLADQTGQEVEECCLALIRADARH